MQAARTAMLLLHIQLIKMYNSAYKEILDSQVTGQKKVRFIKSYICRTMHTITAFSYVPKQIILLFLLFSVLNAACKKNNDDQNLPDDITESLLPDTGQLKSYTSTPGEDADFIINPPSYTDNSNGRITDNVTGLMWQKTDAGEMTFTAAKSYSEVLLLGGYDDWRLPTGLELFSINNYDNVNPALNTVFFTKTAAEYWWTIETRADAPANVWVVNAGGGIGAHPENETISAGGTKRFHVRAVRKTRTPEDTAVRFTDNEDGTITDNLTGLIWQKIHPASLMTWEEALVYAYELSLAGHGDWRIPNVKELQSLNITSIFKPSFDKNYFTNVLSGNYWSSTTLVNSTTKAWDINVDYGIVSYNEKAVKEFVLCVR
jgi:hypothetical protein